MDDCGVLEEAVRLASSGSSSGSGVHCDGQQRGLPRNQLPTRLSSLVLSPSRRAELLRQSCGYENIYSLRGCQEPATVSSSGAVLARQFHPFFSKMVFQVDAAHCLLPPSDLRHTERNGESPAKRSPSPAAAHQTQSASTRNAHSRRSVSSSGAAKSLKKRNLSSAAGIASTGSLVASGRQRIISEARPPHALSG
jgi:hypothetical protein